jgi:pyruvate/2-oxoglutarate dehydrogenase complex dihydrolipoamide dehydrogenase (E3) component
VDYDVVVIGGGAAGLAAAGAAVRAQVRVLLVGEIGGDCTFTGCVPSKTLIDAAAHGVPFADAMARVRATVARIAATETAEVLRGRARFTGPDAIEVDGRSLRCSRIVIATGAAPSVPPIDGFADTSYLTTESVFDLTDPPESLAILGGGAAGCELAQAFARVGVEVSIVEAEGRLLPSIEPDASMLLAKVFAVDGITVHTDTQVPPIGNQSGRVVLGTSAGREVSAQRLLVAVGRRPATAAWGWTRPGCAPMSGVSWWSTSTWPPPPRTCTPQATSPGCFRNPRRIRDGAGRGRRRAAPVPSPLVRRDGDTAGRLHRPGNCHRRGRRTRLTDRRARVAFLPMSDLDRAITADRTQGFVKLIAGPGPMLGNLGGGRVLGATIMCQRAGELIHEPALVMRTDMFTGRLAQTVHAYPTWSIAVQQAAAQFFGGYGGHTARRTGQPHGK